MYFTYSCQKVTSSPGEEIISDDLENFVQSIGTPKTMKLVESVAHVNIKNPQNNFGWPKNEIDHVSYLTKYVKRTSMTHLYYIIMKRYS